MRSNPLDSQSQLLWWMLMILGVLLSIVAWAEFLGAQLAT
jgi:hypothetical protein